MSATKPLYRLVLQNRGGEQFQVASQPAPFGEVVAAFIRQYAGRAQAVHTEAGERIPADVVVLDPDLPVAYRTLLPATRTPSRVRRLRYSPSCVVIHIGAWPHYTKIAHHNLHFGRAWNSTFADVITDGRIMRDRFLLVTNPSRTDPSLAPDGGETYCVLAPVPNLDGGGPSAQAWRDGLGERYADELVRDLERRGYVGLADRVVTRRVITPADWLDQVHAAGTPFAAAHRLGQTGPFRPGNLHPGLSNVVFVGSGTQAGVGVPMVLISGTLAAQRVSGAS